jgi:hypothetical protein
MRKLPSIDPYDKDFRRLKYIRYADDMLLGFIGSKEEAIRIKQEIADFLKNELRLELSMDKTLITNASEEKARFLNYEINTGIVNDKQTKGKNNIKIRTLNYRIQLRMPKDVLREWIVKYTKRNKPIHRSGLMNLSDFDIVRKYDLELRGLYNYYILALNVSRLNELKYYMKCSLVKTLASKYKSKATNMYRKYINRFTKAIEVKIPRGNKKNLIASFGDISLRRKENSNFSHQEDKYMIVHRRRSELLDRLLNDKCELCGVSKNINVHHIKKISDLKRRCEGKKDIPKWKELMITINRKTLIVCNECHNLIHSGKYDGRKLTKV